MTKRTKDKKRKLFPEGGKKIFGVLKRIAPAIATVVTGGAAAPLLGLATRGATKLLEGNKHPLAQTAVKFVGEHVLGNPAATAAEVDAVLRDPSPEQLVALKQADQAFQVRMKELDVDVFELEVEDVQHARDFGARTTLAPQMLISVLFLGGFFLVLYWAMTKLLETAVPDNVMPILTLLLGLLVREVPTIMQFWMGSSHGSKAKSDGQAQRLEEQLGQL